MRTPRRPVPAAGRIPSASQQHQQQKEARHIDDGRAPKTLARLCRFGPLPIPRRQQSLIPVTLPFPRPP
jgi:hypothetical protein